MRSRGPERSLVRALAVPILALALSGCTLLSGCTWKAWIPGEKNWNPDIVVDPARLARQLSLESTLVDELDCYAFVCDQRFRVIVGEAGTLTVRALFELQSQDQQARLVLEAVSGVLGQDNTGRGPRTDVRPLVVRREVERGTYFVLIQSLGGGRAPYELTASLTPFGGTDTDTLATPEVPVELGRLEEVDLGGAAGAAFDPEVAFGELGTFAFPSFSSRSAAAPAGTALLAADDRAIRRFLAEGLALKGLRQAEGGEEPDLLVDFATGDASRRTTLGGSYGRYEKPAAVSPLSSPGNRLVVDIVERDSDRLAWHAWSSLDSEMGRDRVRAENLEPKLRRVVADVLKGFPPR